MTGRTYVHTRSWAYGSDFQKYIRHNTHTTGSSMKARQILQFANSLKEAKVCAAMQIVRKGIPVRNLDIPTLIGYFFSRPGPISLKGRHASSPRDAAPSPWRLSAFSPNSLNRPPRSNSARLIQTQDLKPTSTVGGSSSSSSEIRITSFGGSSRGSIHRPQPH